MSFPEHIDNRKTAEMRQRATTPFPACFYHLHLMTSLRYKWKKKVTLIAFLAPLSADFPPDSNPSTFEIKSRALELQQQVD